MLILKILVFSHVPQYCLFNLVVEEACVLNRFLDKIRLESLLFTGSALKVPLLSKYRGMDVYNNQ